LQRLHVSVCLLNEDRNDQNIWEFPQMISFAVVAVMTAMTGCHGQKACDAAPAPVVHCAPAPVAECKPAKKCNLNLGGLFHKKACAPAPACEPAPVACEPAPKKHCGIKLGGLFHKKACAPAPVACETVVVAAPVHAPVAASPQASGQH
jgi:hypothetical protein